MDDASVLLDLVRLRQGDPAAVLEELEQTRTLALSEAGLVRASQRFVLRHQEVPAASLGETCVVLLHSLVPAANPPPWEPLPEIELLGSTRYDPIATFGDRETPEQARHASLMLVLTHPTDLAYDDAFNAWYTDEHAPDVAQTPGFLGGTRYRPLAHLGGAPLGYLCLYEVSPVWSPDLHAGLERWQMETEVVDRVPMPQTSAGEPVLTIDLWAYFERVS